MSTNFRISVVLVTIFLVFQHFRSSLGSVTKSQVSHFSWQNMQPDETTFLLHKSAVTEKEANRLLSEYHRLEALTIIDCRALEGLECNNELSKSLKSLIVSDSPVGDDLVEFVARCSRLESLNLNSCCVTSRAWSRLRMPNSLSSFSISGMPFNDAAFELLATYPNLKDLSLERCAISDQGVFSVLPRLRVQRISFSGSLVTDACVDIITKCELLSSVNIGNTLITKAGVVELCKAMNIVTLDVSGISLELDAIHSLASLPKLELLVARQCFISEGQIQELLSKSKSIRSIWLSDSDIDLDSAERIRHAFPNVALQLR